jgi:hypothetical protein
MRCGRRVRPPAPPAGADEKASRCQQHHCDDDEDDYEGHGVARLLAGDEKAPRH